MSMILRSAIKEAVTALDGISFEVAAGTICAIVGPNGAGKSTLFRVLTGLTTPTEGTATVMGLDTERQSTAVRKVVGFVPADDRSLYLRHTARENLLFHGNLQGMNRKTLRAKADAALDLVGLAHARERVGFALSAGMRARLQLARALLHEPAVLILDEPTGSVDPVGSYDLLQTLEAITVERKLAVLISSHRLEEIEALHDHVLLLDQGVIVHQGDLDTLRRKWDNPRLHIRFDSVAAADAAARQLEGVGGVDVVATEEAVVTLSSNLGTGRVLDLLDGQVARVVLVEETKISLRELLASVARTGPSQPRTDRTDD
jgi:ABC-2 type transport system ATP-binding protein